MAMAFGVHHAWVASVPIPPALRTPKLNPPFPPVSASFSRRARISTLRVCSATSKKDDPSSDPSAMAWVGGSEGADHHRAQGVHINPQEVCQFLGLNLIERIFGEGDPIVSTKKLTGTEMGHSIEGPGVNLLYGAYMDHLWVTLKEKLPGFQQLDLTPEYRVQKASKKARVHNWLCCGDKLRRVRLTYFDGGASGQAFNSLLYPDTRYDLPLLGIDLLSFGSNKVLCVVDFQPLCQDSDYLDRHTSVLAPIHARFRDKCGKMTSKFFDENQFFSKYLIFYRSSLGPKEPVLQVPTGQLWEVYRAYVDIYLEALNAAPANEDVASMEYVQSRQDAYDQYNAERDPAIKLFNTYFGSEWSAQYTKDFLFPGATL